MSTDARTDEGTSQAATERQARAEAQARENIADFGAVASAIVSLAEAITAKQGTMALDQLVRQRCLTADAAARVWRRSGREQPPVESLPGIKEYREQFGYRRPGELDNSGPRPVSRSVTFDADDTRKRASGLADERRYQREIAERSQLRPEVAAFRHRNGLDMSGPRGSDLAVQERVQP